MNLRKTGLFAAAAIALAVALVFLFVGDGTGGGSGADGLAFVVLEYFHALTWALLAFFLVLLALSARLAPAVGYLALASYATFLLTLALH